MKIIKCENCGATMQNGNDKNLLFCPYCGASLKKDETILDYAKFKAEHDEAVRQRKIKEEKKSNRNWIIGSVIFLIVLFGLLGILLLAQNADDQKLEKLTAEIQQLIIDGDYETAMVKVQSIRVEKDGLFDERYRRWENQRKDLIKLIEQKQQESR